MRPTAILQNVDVTLRQAHTSVLAYKQNWDVVMGDRFERVAANKIITMLNRWIDCIIKFEDRL